MRLPRSGTIKAKQIIPILLIWRGTYEIVQKASYQKSRCLKFLSKILFFFFQVCGNRSNEILWTCNQQQLQERTGLLVSRSLTLLSAPPRRGRRQLIIFPIGKKKDTYFYSFWKGQPHPTQRWWYSKGIYSQPDFTHCWLQASLHLWQAPRSCASLFQDISVITTMCVYDQMYECGRGERSL